MGVSQEQFRSAADHALALREEEALRLLVEGRYAANLGAGVRFVVRRDDPRVRARFEGVEGGYEAFREALPDIADVITAAVDNRGSEEFAEARSSESDPFQDEPDLAVWKYKLVEDLFPMVELRERRWVKATSKNPTARALDWEVSTKVLDDDAKRPSGPVPYATVKLEAGGIAGTLLEVLTGATDGTTVITLDVEDVGYYIDTLLRLKEALIRVGSGDQGV